jgi:hypothetical protein
MTNLVTKFNLIWARECVNVQFKSCAIALLVGIITAVLFIEVAHAPRVNNEIPVGLSCVCALYAGSITIACIWLSIECFKCKYLNRYLHNILEEETSEAALRPELSPEYCHTMLNEEDTISRYINMINNRLSTFIDMLDSNLNSDEDKNVNKSVAEQFEHIRDQFVMHINILKSIAQFNKVIDKLLMEMNARGRLISRSKPSEETLAVLELQKKNLDLIKDAHSLCAELNKKIADVQYNIVLPSE